MAKVVGFVGHVDSVEAPDGPFFILTYVGKSAYGRAFDYLFYAEGADAAPTQGSIEVPVPFAAEAAEKLAFKFGETMLSALIA